MTLDLADVKPTLYSFFVVGTMAMLFIVLLKIVMAKYPVPGLAEIANAA